jgi:hypothetical protein
MRILAHPFAHVSPNQPTDILQCVKRTHKTPPKHNLIPQTAHNAHQVVPPPQCTYVDSRPKTQKPPNLNSPIIILFVKQRKSLKFLQNTKVQLVTLFLVHLRVFPFSDEPQKSPISQKFSKAHPIDRHSSPFSWSLIRGP